MYFDLATSGPDRLSVDVAIIGSGAAGLTIARELLASGCRVALLESGGVDYEPAAADLNIGENVGEEYYELEHARLRFFGGTTAIWGGRCAELDPIDFEKRDWVPHSGWPISYEKLRPFYNRAREVFGLPSEMSSEDLTRASEMLIPFDTNIIQPRFWLFDEKFNRFTFESCRDLRDHPLCTIVTHATVSDIIAREDRTRVWRLEVRSSRGARLSVYAEDYVLAAGGIENARLLLVSRGVTPEKQEGRTPNGLGNDHDQVGRYFMEHPHARGGRVVTDHAWKIISSFDVQLSAQSHRIAPLLTPGLELQRRGQLLNTSLTISARKPAQGREALAVRAYKHLKHEIAPSRAGRAVWMYSKKMTRWAQSRIDPFRPWLLHRLGRADLALVVRAEQAPNPDSRVLLSDQRDQLGVQRIQLDWRTSPIDVHSVKGLVTALDSELKRMGLGSVEPADWLQDQGSGWRTDPLISAHPIGGFHHMGTTRMSDNPKTGVTDSEGRVHGVGNLYVAGSSLFPTSGWANPTLTIVALALRTAQAILATRARLPADGNENTGRLTANA